MLRSPSIRNLLLLTITALTLMITLLASKEVYVNWRQLAKIESLKEAVSMSDKLFDATEKLSEERDVAYAILHAPDSETVQSLQPLLEESGRAADEAFKTSMEALKQYDYAEVTTIGAQVEKQLQALQALRQQINQAVLHVPQHPEKALSDRWFAESTTLIVQIQDLWVEFSRHFANIDPIVTQHLRYKHYLRIISDYTGRERAIIDRLIVENADPTPDEFSQLLRGQGIIEISWKMSHVLADQSGLLVTIAPYFTEAKSHYLNLYSMVHDIFYVQGGRRGGAYPIGVDLWLELSSQAKESFTALKEASLKEIRNHVFLLETQAREAILTHSLILLFAVILCFYSFWVITHRVIRPINAMVAALLDATQGKSTPIPPVAHAGDEIGKLAQVLHAFQKNTEKIRRTSIMLENYTHALERSNKELDDFAYIASHDLKEPLRGLFNHATFLLEDYQDKLDEDGVRKLHRLSYLAQRMERLVNDLLYFSRLGRQELAIQPTDISEVIRDIENTLELFLEERHAHIVVPNPLPLITCDKTRITEAFRNLITNAIKYNDQPEKTVEVGYLKSALSPAGAEMKGVFYVKDNGRGIPAEFYEEIFRIFKRLQSSKDSGEEGTGAGLTFVKKIIDRHNGKIWLDSEVGKGTTFYFTLGMG